MNLLAIQPHRHGAHFVDLVAIDFEQIAVEHDEIGSLAHFDRIQLVRSAQLECGVTRVTVEQ